MSINLDDYKEFLEDRPAIREVLEASFQEASRLMSPTGLQTYLDGAKSLCSLGRGSDLVITYLQEMPLVVKECGEDIIPDCLTAAMKLSSMTSGEVISLLFSSLPSAARNLGDAELLRGYLTFIHQLASTAELTSGKTSRRPVVLIRGVTLPRGPGSVAEDVIMPAEQDLFR